MVAKVNGISLKSTQLQSELISFRLRAEHQGGKIIPSKEAKLVREMLKAEIMKELIAQKARSLNIKITSKNVDLEIQNIEDKFPSHTAFLTALAFQRLNIEALRKKIENTLLEDELIRQEIAPKVKLNDGSVKEFYNANKEKFSKPVLYRMRHILVTTILPPKTLENEAHRKKALRMTKIINSESKLKAEELLEKLKEGKDFIQLVQEFSEDENSKEEGGMLGDLHPDSTIPEIAAVMVKLNEGEFSDIIKSPIGFHILKLDKIIPSTLIPFEKAEADILNLLMKRKTQKIFKKYLIDLEKNAKIDIFI